MRLSIFLLCFFSVVLLQSCESSVNDQYTSNVMIAEINIQTEWLEKQSAEKVFRVVEQTVHFGPVWEPVLSRMQAMEKAIDEIELLLNTPSTTVDSSFIAKHVRTAFEKELKDYFRYNYDNAYVQQLFFDSPFTDSQGGRALLLNKFRTVELHFNHLLFYRAEAMAYRFNKIKPVIATIDPIRPNQPFELNIGVLGMDTTRSETFLFGDMVDDSSHIPQWIGDVDTLGSRGGRFQFEGLPAGKHLIQGVYLFPTDGHFIEMKVQKEIEIK